jgi:hypothetical protein
MKYLCWLSVVKAELDAGGLGPVGEHDGGGALLTGSEHRGL